jgi:pimeloyl-ACP methyl ester carboxylesterase
MSRLIIKKGEKALMKSILAVLTAGFLISACVSTTESPTVDARSAASVILLEKTVYFTAPDGTAVPVNPGGYVVEAGDKSLRLTVPDGETPLVVAASPGTHDEAVMSPTPLSFAEDGEQADLHHLVLLFPDGKSLDAVGTYSGIAPRGLLRDRLAQRPLIQKARQMKEQVQARIHDRLFGGPPPFSAGPNAFNVAFNERAVGAAPANAYLLTYLVTLIYPEFLDQLSGDPLKQDIDYVKRLHTTPEDFVQEYAGRTHHLFWNAAAPPGPANQPPQYVWVWGRSGGWDPEAMVISTAKSVVVVIRGTDRVAGKQKFGYNWAEWIQSDFRAMGVPPDVPGLSGRVHRGFWESMTAPAMLYVPSGNPLPAGIPNNQPFRESLLAVIKAFGSGQKPIWVVGHSLGAAQAQLYGAYLTVKGVSPQGVYAVAAPHVGDRTFVDQLNGMFPNQRLQRFDFVHDPVTMVPPSIQLPQAPGTPPIIYARAGTRLYYDDAVSVQFPAPERNTAEGVRMDGVLNSPIVRFFPPGDFCFHYPQWYLTAAYNQLDQGVVSVMPSPLPTPVMRGDVYSRLCGPVKVTRGNRSPKTVLGNMRPGN